jgi:hypothetical protein
MTEGKNFAEFILRFADTAGVPAQAGDANTVSVHCDLRNGRKQEVFIRPLAAKTGGHVLIGFHSLAMRIPEGSSLGRETANNLLRDNSRIGHGSWAVERFPDGEYLVAFDTQMSHTMDAEEFRASVEAVAKLADGMEERYGVDDF